MNSILSYQNQPGDDYYTILGCDELSSMEQIMAEYKSKVLSCHPDKCQDDTGSAARFAKLQKAKEVLTDSEQRKNYDKWRCSGLAMSFEEWVARRAHIQTSMHWATKKKKEPMLEGPSTKPSDEQTDDCDSWINANWRRESGNDVLRAFRNYEI